jgi:hypothetical protein
MVSVEMLNYKHLKMEKFLSFKLDELIILFKVFQIHLIRLFYFVYINYHDISMVITEI